MIGAADDLGPTIPVGGLIGGSRTIGLPLSGTIPVGLAYIGAAGELNLSAGVLPIDDLRLAGMPGV